MDHDSKKIIRMTTSAITVKVVTESDVIPQYCEEHDGPKGVVTLKKSSTYAIDPMTIETEETRAIHGDPIPEGKLDPSVEQFLKMLEHPAVQQVFGLMVQTFISPPAASAGSDGSQPDPAMPPTPPFHAGVGG